MASTRVNWCLAFALTFFFVLLRADDLQDLANQLPRCAVSGCHVDTILLDDCTQNVNVCPCGLKGKQFEAATKLGFCLQSACDYDAIITTTQLVQTGCALLLGGYESGPDNSGSGSGGSGSGSDNSGSGSGNSGNDGGGGSDGLSTGAKVGIGVGAGVVVIAIVALVVLFVLLKRKKRNRPPVAQNPPPDAPQMQYQPHYQDPALNKQPQTYPLPGQDSSHDPHQQIYQSPDKVPAPVTYQHPYLPPEQDPRVAPYHDPYASSKETPSPRVAGTYEAPSHAVVEAPNVSLPPSAPMDRAELAASPVERRSAQGPHELYAPVKFDYAPMSSQGRTTR